MARVVWKGAVSFGLVHIPVSLVPATVSSGIDFDWLDKRTMDPVGYKRINKASGKEIASENIVRGVEFEKNRYVVLTDEEIRTAYPVATQTVDIVGFVDASEIPLLYVDTPYYLKPENRGEKVYALLREALKKSGRVALANVVLHTKQHLAAVMPVDDVLVLETLRWGDEVRDVDEVGLPDAAVDAKIAARELEMAERLIDEMHEKWDPKRYHEEFTEKIMDLVERKADAGKLEAVAPLESEGERTTSNVIDLAELLRRSLGQGHKGEAPAADAKPRARDGAKTAKAKKSPAKKTAAKTSSTGARASAKSAATRAKRARAG